VVTTHDVTLPTTYFAYLSLLIKKTKRKRKRKRKTKGKRKTKENNKAASRS
jgi:hypothetical protein